MSKDKMIKCPICEAELASSEKECPTCGARIKKPIYKRVWFIILVVFVILYILGKISSQNNNDENMTEVDQVQPVVLVNEQPLTSKSSESEKVESELDIETVKKYSDGTYLVGKDIEAGLYSVKLTDTIMDMGYIERSKGVSMELDDILANIVLTGDGYVEVLESDVAVKLQGVEITPIILTDLEKDIKTEVSDGIYLVGYDLNPGTYKVEVIDEAMDMGYIERASAVSMGFDDIISNEIIQGQGYVEIKETDFAVRIQGANIILQ